ncbi:MAG: DUF3106 domain-containing protein [Bryobacteraceae bacterium]
MIRFRGPLSVVVAALSVALLAPCLARAQGGPPEEGRPPGARHGPRMRPGLTVLDRLERMSPEARGRFFESLPPERRQRLQERFEQYERLSPEERARLRRGLGRFRQLPPDQQDAARRLFSEFRLLPPDRRVMLRQELRRLRWLEPAERAARMDSPAFVGLYSAEERRILRGLLDLTPES